MKNGNGNGKIIEKVKAIVGEWEALKSYLEGQTANLIRMDIEKLVDIRQTFNLLSKSIDNYRQNIDTILKEKVKPNEKVPTPYGTLKRVCYEHEVYDYGAMKERLAQMGELNRYLKKVEKKDFIKVFPKNGK